MKPYFHSPEDHDDFVVVQVELEGETDDSYQIGTLAVTKDDLMNGAENAGMFDCRTKDYRVVMEDMHGVEHEYNFFAHVWLDTHAVFSAIHEKEPFKLILHTPQNA
jgi:hypothetical protein